MEIDIDDKIRFIVLYRDAGFSIRKIQQIIGGSLRTLNFWKQRLEDGENILDIKEGRGRKKKIVQFFQKINNYAKASPHRVSLRSSGAKFGLSKTSTGRALHELGFSHKKIVVQQTLKKDEKSERIQFCKELLEFPDEITQSFWADESGMWLSEAMRKKVWIKGNKIVFSAPTGDIKLNMRGTISSKGATNLHIYKENLEGKVYCQILAERKIEMERLFPEGYYYFYDRHSVHKSKVFNDWAKDNGIFPNLLPRKSSDLNPIENIWGWLKGSVGKEAPKSEAALIRSLKRNWKKMNKNFILPYINSLYERCEKCIKAKGDYINY